VRDHDLQQLASRIDYEAVLTFGESIGRCFAVACSDDNCGELGADRGDGNGAIWDRTDKLNCQEPETVEVAVAICEDGNIAAPADVSEVGAVEEVSVDFLVDEEDLLGFECQESPLNCGEDDMAGNFTDWRNGDMLGGEVDTSLQNML
jgi:hypothetical protein